MNDSVTLDIREGVGRLTLSRPEKLNALAHADWTLLGEKLLEADASRDVRVLVITGAGDKAFSTGADLGELAQRDSYAAYENARRLQRICGTLTTMRKPSIAMINGYAVGGGFELALCATFRVAADSAQVGLPEVKVGTLAGAGGTQRVSRIAPSGVALRMLLLGDLLTATEALEAGLVDDVAPVDELEDTVQALARRLCENDPRTNALILDSVRLVTETPIHTGLSGEAALFGMTTSYDDYQQRIARFLAKE